MMSGAKSQKPRCACTGVVLWLNDPPRYEHKSGAELRDMRMPGRIVRVHSTEQSV